MRGYGGFPGIVLVGVLVGSAVGAGSSKEPGTLEETARPAESGSSFWWLNSGGRIEFDGDEMRTIHGALPPGDRWRKHYARSNPADTEGGRLPQNVLRLVTRPAWVDVTETIEFLIHTVHPTPSPNRNGSNGVLLFARYLDGDNLYYAGVRVDGHAVVKRKRNGRYTTVASRKVFPGTYHPSAHPSLIPSGRWIGLRVRVANESAAVRITLSVDVPGPGDGWQVVLDVRDGSPAAIRQGGRAGVRTDFMDVTFRSYEAVGG